MGVLWNSGTSKTRASSATMDDSVPTPKAPKPRRYGWLVFALIVLGALVVLGFVIAQEIRSSRLQAREFSRFAASLSYSMHAGPSDAMFYPGEGPFDKRLGYSALGDFLPRLQKRDYVITQQNRFSRHPGWYRRCSHRDSHAHGQSFWSWSTDPSGASRHAPS